MARARRRNRRARRIIRRLLALLTAGAALAGAALGLLVWAETHPPAEDEQSQALIVLGAQVYASGQLSPQLELRMEAALDSYRKNPRPVIVCGAQGKKEPAPEGDVMRQWLIDRGVPEEQIIAETQSVNTRQNLENAIRLLPEGAERVTVVTSDYHLPRALSLARDLGLDPDGIGSPCQPRLSFWIKNHGRELLAWGKYLGEKYILGK